MNFEKPIKKFFGKWVLIPIAKLYLSKERKVRIGGISLKIPSGVFYPSLFLSTKFLLKYIDNQIVTNFKTLELGAGSGLLSIAMAKQGAVVTASDISKNACNAVQENAKINNVSIEIIHSDLFDNFGKITFDLILINPPYFPKNPKNEAEYAWFCGENFEYFEMLFIQLRDFLVENGKVIMVLSEDCDILKISKLAIKNNLSWKQIAKRKTFFEWNYLFEITIQLS